MIRVLIAGLGNMGAAMRWLITAISILKLLG